MEQKVKTDRIPAQAHHLYIKLYCERKGVKDKKTLLEAKKSWASLSLPKKKLFYQTTTNRNLLDYAHGLSKTKTYLKEKEPKLRDQQLCEPQHSNEEHPEKLERQETVASIDERYSTGNGTHIREENEFINEQTENNTNLEDANESQVVETQANVERPIDELSLSNCGIEDAGETQEVTTRSPSCDPSPQVDEIEDALETQSNASSIQRAVVPVPEPTPPIVKLGKDLYEIIKRPGHADWKDVSAPDKAHYNLAVRNIKREYIKSYKNYLENLSQQQLFDHYIKTLKK